MHQRECQRARTPGHTKWTREEDAQLLSLATRFGDGDSKDWNMIAFILKTRSPRQCRERYKNHTKPGIHSGL